MLRKYRNQAANGSEANPQTASAYNIAQRFLFCNRKFTIFFIIFYNLSKYRMQFFRFSLWK